MKNIFYYAFLLMIAVMSCKKQDQPDTAGTRLKMIKIGKDSVLYQSFFYDQDKLISIKDSDNNGHLSAITLECNAGGKLVIVKKTPPNAVHFFMEEGRDSLVYDNDLIRKKISVNYSTASFITNAYAYDAAGRLIADTVYDYTKNEAMSYTSFTYDGNDNVVKLEFFHKTGSGIYLSHSITTASYDSQINPWHNLNVPVYFISIGDNFLISRNNVKTITNSEYYTNGTLNYEYEYNSNGLPLKSAYGYNTIPATPFPAGGTEYFYE